MDTKVDMTYRFLWNSEPKDEQLHITMQEVAAKANGKCSAKFYTP